MFSENTGTSLYQESYHLWGTHKTSRRAGGSVPVAKIQAAFPKQNRVLQISILQWSHMILKVINTY